MVKLPFFQAYNRINSHISRRLYKNTIIILREYIKMTDAYPSDMKNRNLVKNQI